MHFNHRSICRILVTIVAGAGSVVSVWWLSHVALAAVPDKAKGVWIGSLDFGGSSRAFAFQLEERHDNRLVGYVLGGTGSRTIVDGARRGADVTFALELRDPVRTTMLTIAGRLHGDTLTGTADEGAVIQPVLLRRTSQVLDERRFLSPRPTPPVNSSPSFSLPSSSMRAGAL